MRDPSERLTSLPLLTAASDKEEVRLELFDDWTQGADLPSIEDMYRGVLIESLRRNELLESRTRARRESSGGRLGFHVHERDATIDGRRDVARPANRLDGIWGEVDTHSEASPAIVIEKTTTGEKDRARGLTDHSRGGRPERTLGFADRRLRLSHRDQISLDGLRASEDRLPRFATLAGTLRTEAVLLTELAQPLELVERAI